MGTFRNTKVARSLARLANLLTTISQVCGDDGVQKVVCEVVRGLESCHSRMDRRDDFDGASGLAYRRNVARTLLTVLSLRPRGIYTQIVHLKLRDCDIVAMDALNHILIDEPLTLCPGEMEAAWNKTRRGNFYRRHQVGIELLVEAPFTQGGEWSGSIAEVLVARGPDEHAVKEMLETMTNNWFAACLEHHKRLDVAAALFGG